MSEILKNSLKHRLINQRLHPEVVDFVTKNHQALIELKEDEFGITPVFIFDAARISLNTAEKISELRKYLKPNQVLAWQDEGSGIGNPFKQE